MLFDNNLEVMPGEIVIMTGPSGSGKTTLLTLIGALRTVQEGILEVVGRPLNGLSEKELVQVRRRIGFIFQNFSLVPVLSAYENVEYPLLLIGTPATERRERTRRRLCADRVLDRAAHAVR